MYVKYDYGIEFKWWTCMKKFAADWGFGEIWPWKENRVFIGWEWGDIKRSGKGRV
jgi:hypothetical protein